MSTFTQIKADVVANINDAGGVHVTSAEVDVAIQDAYSDIAFQARNIIKRVTLNWNAAPYLNLLTLVNSDYLGCVALFNNVNNQWLDDTTNLKQLDQLREDWELWTGSPIGWAPHSVERIAVFPHYPTAAGTFDLIYYATAPTVSGGDTPLIATDMQILLKLYATATLLDSPLNLVISSQVYWSKYFELLEQYKMRIRKLSKSDLLQIS